MKKIEKLDTTIVLFTTGEDARMRFVSKINSLIEAVNALMPEEKEK